jgi:DNA-binding LacI/PurR family transcriptional regulator
MPTITDIAKLAKVSKATVSLSLSDDPRVAAKTKQLVLQIAEQLGYVPNRMAVGLSKSRSRLIGVVFFNPLEESVENLFSDTVMGISVNAMRFDYNVVLFGFSDQDYSDVAKKVLLSNVDGLIVISTVPQLDGFADLTKLNLPIVFIGKRKVTDINPKDMLVVATDNWGGGRLAAEHLQLLGHEKVTVLLPHAPTPWEEERAHGFLSVSFREAHKLHIHTSSSLSELDGCGSIKDLTGSAVFAVSPIIGLNILRQARAANIRVPHDLSVMVFDDFSTAPFETPSLTVIKQDMKSLGKLALQLAIDRIERTMALPTQLLVATTLVERESCLPRT